MEPLLNKGSLGRVMSFMQDFWDLSSLEMQQQFVGGLPSTWYLVGNKGGHAY